MGNQSTTFPNPSGNDNKSPLSQSVKPLDRVVKRLSLSRLHLTKNRKKKVTLYPVPPDAERPSPPSCPEVFQDQDQYFILRWAKPAFDGGCPIMGYVIQHLELGLPQLENQDQDDTEAWYSSEPGQITQTECILNNLVPGTTYQFRVLAENIIGYSQPSEVSEAIVFNPNGELDDWFFPPEFTATLEESYTVMEHEMVTLTVELKGQPYPVVRWYDKHDQDLSKLNNKRYKTKSSGFRRSLVINSVELSDSGTIKCIGMNKEGQVECYTIMNVEAPPRIKRVQNPEFLQNPYDMNEQEEERLNTFLDDDYEDLIFQSGELVRLKFMYWGAPQPEITLFHNGDLVDDSRVVTEFTEKMITVRIESIDRGDRGEWLVKLENVLGEDCTSVLITITDTPLPPGMPEILQLSDNTCILRWDEPTDDGGCPVHNFIVEYFRSEWGVWLKALTSKNPGAKIKDLIPGSKYRFRVKAENLYGVSEPSEESAEILITDAPSRNNDSLLMSTLEESMEEEPMEILSYSDFQDENDAFKQNQPTIPPRSPRLGSKYQENVSNFSSPAVYNRGDLIRSADTSSVDYVQRYLNESAAEITKDEEIDDGYEYDFEKLQREYEEEMNGLREQLEESSGEDFDDEKDQLERPRSAIELKSENNNPDSETTGKDYQEEEFEWPRRRIFRSEEKSVFKTPVLHDKFKDYLTMKASSKDKLKIGSSIRSLNSSNDAKSEKTQSRENFKQLLDFEDDFDGKITSFVDENPDEAVNLHEVRKAIILNEERQEKERVEIQKRKEETRLQEMALRKEREAALEARRKANRKQKSEELVENLEPEKVIDPAKMSKMVVLGVPTLMLMMPVMYYGGIMVGLFVLILLLLLKNKYGR